MSVSNIIDSSTGKIAPKFIPFIGGQYYKSVLQNFPSGTLDITFDTSMNWTNTTYISQTSSNEFTVNIDGIYQLEFNVAVNPNGATWTNFSKICQIDITRGSESSLTSQYGYANTGSFYALQTSATYELLQGDIISCEAVSVHTGTPQIAPISGVNFDLNTFFTWTLIKSL